MKGEFLFNEYTVSLSDDEKVLEMHSFTALWMYLIPMKWSKW